MADIEEKVIPEAAEAKAEVAAPTEEMKAEETKSAEEKKEKAPKGKKKGLPIGVVLAAVLVLAVGGAALFAFICGNRAVAAYNDKKYEEAYENSHMAFFLNAADKECINFAYVSEVLYPAGDYYKAAALAENITMEEAKARLEKNCPLLKLCKKGQIVTFGKYETDADAGNGQEDLEWIVMDVADVGDGRKAAVLLTKDIIATPEGWNRGKNDNIKYSESNLNDWCTTLFYSEMMQANASLDERVFKVSVQTGDDSLKAKAYAPSKEELEKYLTGDLAPYLKAVATDAAKGSLSQENGAGEEGTGTGSASSIASYYVRNASVDGIGGYTTGGVYVNNLSASDKTIGARVCINVNLGAAE